MIRLATIEGAYRYRLERRVEVGPVAGGNLCFVMLNPSTADAFVDDATIRKCWKFAMREHFRGIVVVNLFAFRATDPAEMWRANAVTNIVGFRNDFFIKHAVAEADAVVVAWGRLPKQAQARADAVIEMIFANDGPPSCLGVNKDGSPKHPLYLADSTPFRPWSKQ